MAGPVEASSLVRVMEAMGPAPGPREAGALVHAVQSGGGRFHPRQSQHPSK